VEIMTDDKSADNEPEDDGQGSPVYVSWATILNLIERMERESIPSQIDKSYLSNMAGGYQGQVLLALRTLGLIDKDGVPGPILKSLVSEPESRRATIKKLIGQEYGWAIALGPSATHQQLVEAFKSRGTRLSPNTRDKAIAFYLHAANYAGLQYSPFFKGKRPTGASTTPVTRTRRKRPVQQRENGSSNLLDSRSNPPVLPTDEDRKNAYFNLLLKMAETKDGQADIELLNRIERLLGVAAEGRKN
jgi:hypothetical protein